MNRHVQIAHRAVRLLHRRFSVSPERRCFRPSFSSSSFPVKGKPADGCCEEEEEEEDGAGTPLPESAVCSGSAVLRCDIMIGSALIYSPHHACVADVLLLAFAEGRCRAAHIVQLSTRCFCAFGSVEAARPQCSANQLAQGGTHSVVNS